jgi:hypothetical protein
MTGFRRTLLLLSGMMAAIPMLCYAASGLSTYKADVTYVDNHRANVEVAFTIIVSGKSTTQSVRMVLYPNQQIENWQGEDTASSIEIPSSTGGTTIKVMPDATGTYSLKYSVVSASNLTHVPLPVPDSIPASREHFVLIDVTLPRGSRVYDDVFPQKVWVDDTHATAHLPAVPSVVAIRFASADRVTWLTRWKSVGRLSTLLMLLILLGGSLVLYLNKRLAISGARK